MFTTSVREVRGTKIFGRVSDAEQLLAYSMRVDADAELAMVLPLPIALGRGEDAVRFIDLSGHAKLFEDLEALFPGDLGLGLGAGGQEVAASAHLAVHEVGSFVASYVPTMADFSRLDPRFQLSPEVWSALPQFADYGFAVFQLAAGNREVHPMALAFPTRDPSRIYFPCVHVHDGVVHATATFDHRLYCQAAAPPQGWERSIWPPEQATIGASRGVLTDAHVHRLRLSGPLDNRDVYASSSSK